MKPIWALWTFLLGMFLGVGIIVTYRDKTPPSAPGAPARELIGMTATQEVRPVYVYPKAVNKRLQVGPAVDVLTATKVGDKTITAGMDTEGRTTLYIRTDPLPWFAREKKYTGSLNAVWMDSVVVYRGRMTLNLAQTKNIHWGVSLWADKHPDETKVYAGVGFSW